MANITNPQVIRFVNESVRLMAALLNELQSDVREYKRTWDSQIAPMASGADPADQIADCRAAAGTAGTIAGSPRRSAGGSIADSYRGARSKRCVVIASGSATGSAGAGNRSSPVSVR